MKIRGVAAATIVGGSATPAPEKTTEEQARAIMYAAQRAVEEEEARRDEDGGAWPGLSMKKSLQWFLEGRKNKAIAATDAAAGIHHLQLEDDSMSSTSSSKY